MSWLTIAVVLAIVALVFGFVAAAKWLFIVAAVLFVLGVASYLLSGRRTRTGAY